jgi:hypothetical protein
VIRRKNLIMYSPGVWLSVLLLALSLPNTAFRSLPLSTLPLTLPYPAAVLLRFLRLCLRFFLLFLRLYRFWLLSLSLDPPETAQLSFPLTLLRPES